MEKIDFGRLKKMPPDQRAKVLKEIQEALTNLIKERSKEISDSETEIKDAQDFLKEAEEELSVLEEMQSQAPELKGVNVEKLFEKDEPREERGPRGRELESIAAEAPSMQTPDEQRAYVSNLSRQPISSIYDRVNQIRDDIDSTGTISNYQQGRLDQFRDAIHMKEDAIRSGDYKNGWKKESEITAAEKAIMYASSNEGKTFYSTQR